MSALLHAAALLHRAAEHGYHLTEVWVGDRWMLAHQVRKQAADALALMASPPNGWRQ